MSQIVTHGPATVFQDCHPSGDSVKDMLDTVLTTDVDFNL
jgi:hypothetical protein